MIILPIIFVLVVPLLMMIGVIVAPEEYLSSFGDINLLKTLLNIPLSYNDYQVAAILVVKMFILPIFLLVPGILPAITLYRRC